MYNQLSIGLSALRANQAGMDIVGQNLANATTPGYHRQLIHLSSRTSVNLRGLEIGTGVDVAYIDRLHSAAIAQSLLQNASLRSQVHDQLSMATFAESVFSPQSAGLPARLDDLFRSLEELSARPADHVSRVDTLQAGQQLAATLRGMHHELVRMESQAHEELQGLVDRTNTLLEEIQTVTHEVRAVKMQGRSPNDLLDRRDALVAELAEILDVSVQFSNDTVVVANGAFLIGESHLPRLALQRSAAGIQVMHNGSDEPLQLASGKLAAGLEAINETTPGYHRQLDTMARGLIATLDAQHAQGVGLAGSFSRLLGQRSVDKIDVPLSELDLVLPLTNGALTVGVVNQATGMRVNHSISINPQTDSLLDVEARLDAIPGLQATVDPRAGTLALLAQPGLAFDFTGLPPTQPPAALTGTSRPTLGGVFTGDANQPYRFLFSDSGTIGTTPNLRLQVIDDQGHVVDELEVGAGYAPGAPLQLTNGWEISMSAGTVVAGEEFSVPAIAQADETGLLVALGLNTFFSGSDASTLAVSESLLGDPDLLATSLTGQPGDAGNLARLIQRRDLPLLQLQELTIGDSVRQFTAQLGTDVQTLTRAAEGLEIVGLSLQAQRDSLSAVNPDEEMVRLVQHQRAYEAAARYLAAVNQTTQDLILLLQ